MTVASPAVLQIAPTGSPGSSEGLQWPPNGTVTNDSAAAGMIGEYITAQVLVGSAVALTTGVVANVTSIALTAGDWDVSGVVGYHAVGAVTPSDVKQGFNTTSGTMGAQGTYTYDYIGLVIVDDPFYVTPTDRISVPAGGATLYLVAMSDFSGGTSLSAYGNLRARRVR